jgi:ABC-type uncharacterized transport system substrate-binding protein
MRDVVIVTSSDSSFQEQAAERIQKKISGESTRATIVSADDMSSHSRDSNTVYIAIGKYAIEVMNDIDKNAALLRLNNKNIADTKYTSTRSDLITRQAACKHLQLIKAINPKWTTIAVLSSINSADATAELSKCAIKFNFDLNIYAITDETDLQKTLEKAVEYNKVLLAIEDPLVYNSRTVKNILLTSYRHRKPVIGYSDSFVQAGAVAAIFTPPETVADDAVRVLSDFFDNHWQFKRNVYRPSGFSVSTNAQVASSLEIALPDKATIMERIKEMGHKP